MSHLDYLSFQKLPGSVRKGQFPAVFNKAAGRIVAHWEDGFCLRR